MSRGFKNPKISKIPNPGDSYLVSKNLKTGRRSFFLDFRDIVNVTMSHCDKEIRISLLILNPINKKNGTHLFS